MCFCNPSIRTPYCNSYECQQELKRLQTKKTEYEEVTINLSDKEFLVLAKMAHEKNITFNQLCVNIIEEHISREMKVKEYRSHDFEELYKSCGVKLKKYEVTKKDVTYFKIVETIATLSKDKQTQVGALILDVNGKVVSMGYNGCPAKFGVQHNLDDSIVPHTRDPQEIKLRNRYTSLGIAVNKKHVYNKYPFMIHAEQNALLTASDLNRLVGATIYCTHYPCTVCANMITQAGIKTVKVLDNRHGTFEDTIVPTLYIYENMGVDLLVFNNMTTFWIRD